MDEFEREFRDWMAKRPSGLRRIWLYRVKPFFTARFWLRQKTRLKIWRVTGHHFLWNRK